MSLEPVAHVGLMADGWGHDPDDLIAQTRAWLAGNAAAKDPNLTPLGARLKTAGGPGLVPWSMAETWYRADLGLCQEVHLDAQRVTVIQIDYADVADAPLIPSFAADVPDGHPVVDEATQARLGVDARGVPVEASSPATVADPSVVKGF